MGGLIATPHPTAAIVASSILTIPSAAAAAAATAPAAAEASLPRSAAADRSVFPNVRVAGSLSIGYRLRPGDPGDLIFITS